MILDGRNAIHNVFHLDRPRFPFFLIRYHGAPLGQKTRALLLHMRHLLSPRLRLHHDKLGRLRRCLA